MVSVVHDKNGFIEKNIFKRKFNDAVLARDSRKLFLEAQTNLSSKRLTFGSKHFPSNKNTRTQNVFYTFKKE